MSQNQKHHKIEDSLIRFLACELNKSRFRNLKFFILNWLDQFQRHERGL